MPHAPHAAQAHSRVLLDQQLVPDLHYQAVKVLALKGQGQVGRAPGGGGTGKASPGFPLLTVGPGAEKLQLSVPATHVTPPNTTPGSSPQIDVAQYVAPRKYWGDGCEWNERGWEGMRWGGVRWDRIE